MRKTLLIAASLALAAPAAAAPADDFRKLLEDHYAWLLKQSPITATALGVRDYDNSIGDYSEAARLQRQKEVQAFLNRLNAIPARQLSASDRTDRAILKRMLEGDLESERYGQRKMLFTSYYGWHQGFADLANYVPLRTREDFQSYLTRLSLYPQMNDANLKTTSEAVEEGYVLPCSVLTGYEKTIGGVITPDVTKSRFYEPFTRPLPARSTEASGAACRNGHAPSSPKSSTRPMASISIFTG